MGHDGVSAPLRSVDLLVIGDVVLTMEPGDAPLADGAVAVDAGRIVEVGLATELRRRYAPARTVGGAGRLVLPGLVNAHQHLTGDRLIRSTIPDTLESGRAIFEWAVPAHAAHEGDDDELSATLSLLEAVTNGITFTVEAGTVAHPDRVLAAYEAVGVGGTLGSWGWDVAGEPFAGTVEEVLDRQRHVLGLADGHPDVHGWVTLVGHDLMSDELVVAASTLAADHGTALTFHLSPTDSDTVSYLERTGRRPLVHLDALGALGPHVLVGHGVHLADNELDVLLARDVAVAYCPWAYLRLGQGVTRAGRHAEIVERGGRVALGCDTENAGDAIDVLRAAALAAGLAKDMGLDPTRFGAHAALHMATLGGAAALGLDHELGSLAPGKRADIAVVDTSGPAWSPAAGDPVLALVWGSGAAAVRDVVCGGRLVIEQGTSTRVDLAELRRLADERRPRLIERAGLPAG